ncbi:CopD family protein [Fulvimarina sp. MAC8]|uniref:copper resistance D family protein n=1 Tax=Fulvimarina sp. MAC8 TaxID=3162874 RepID=UPI0032EBEBBA
MVLFEGLAPIDGFVVSAIVAKALSYAAAFLSMGGVLFAAAFPELPPRARSALRRATAAAAVAGLVLLVLRIGLRAARISGMGVDGMTDPVMVLIVWESPLGTAVFVQALGFLLALAVLVRGPIPQTASVIGATLIAIAFTEVGHSLGDERAILATLLTLHLLTGAFWVGALYPLSLASGDVDEGPAILERFGRIAGGTVLVLILAGLTFAWISVGSLAALTATAYGLTLLAKIAFVALLLGFAALNKLRLVPAIRTGAPGSVSAFRRSVLVEGGIVGLIFLATAILTSITTPPMNL